MKKLLIIVVILLAVPCLAFGQAAAQAPARLSDKQVKQLIGESRDAVGRFVDKMDPQMRTAILKSATGEVDVKAYLKDIDELGRRMADRYNPPTYGAGTEVAAYLKTTRQLDQSLALRPGMSGADKNWDDARPVLGRLAAAYGIDWNGDPSSWSGRRTSDGEVTTAAVDLKRLAGTLAKQVETALKADKGIDKAARAGMVSQIKGLETAADDFNNQFKGDRDSAAALGRLSETVEKIAGAVPPSALTGPAGDTLQSIKAKLSLMNGAFGK